MGGVCQSKCSASQCCDGSGHCLTVGGTTCRNSKGGCGCDQGTCQNGQCSEGPPPGCTPGTPNAVPCATGKCCDTGANNGTGACVADTVCPNCQVCNNGICGGDCTQGNPQQPNSTCCARNQGICLTQAQCPGGCCQGGAGHDCGCPTGKCCLAGAGSCITCTDIQGASCQNGQCLCSNGQPPSGNPLACPMPCSQNNPCQSGCCDMNSGTCQPGNTNSDCGTSGICSQCTVSGTTCQNGQCLCSNGQPPSGQPPSCPLTCMAQPNGSCPCGASNAAACGTARCFCGSGANNNGTCTQGNCICVQTWHAPGTQPSGSFCLNFLNSPNGSSFCTNTLTACPNGTECPQGSTCIANLCPGCTNTPWVCVTPDFGSGC